MLIRGRILLKAFLLGSLCMVAASCQLLESSESGYDLTFVNRADRPFAPIILDAKDLPLVDPRPWLTAEEFEERKIEVGSSAEVDEAGGVGRLISTTSRIIASSSGIRMTKHFSSHQFR